jgi:RNA polymerase sigma-70 factor, ECF subfamily
MIRVTRINGTDHGDTLRVEGRLTQPNVEELRTECAQNLATGTDLEVDVSALQFADPAGVELLLHLEAEGVSVHSGTGLVGALLKDGRHASPPSDPDAGLVARLRTNDPAAFETLVRTHSGRLLATARRMMPCEDDARDVLQEAFVAAFRSIHAFEGSARLSTWLHRIVVNAALMRMRSKRRRREDSIDDLLPRFAEDGHFVDSVEPWDDAADTLLARAETRTQVRRAIDRLPDNYRAVLVLRDIEELDTEETAAVLGLGTAAVKTRLHRARHALRTLLERELSPARE